MIQACRVWPCCMSCMCVDSCFAFFRVQKKTTSMSLTIRSASPKTPEALPLRSTLVQALSQPPQRVSTHCTQASRSAEAPCPKSGDIFSVTSPLVQTVYFLLSSRCKAQCPHCMVVRCQVLLCSPRLVCVYMFAYVRTHDQTGSALLGRLSRKLGCRDLLPSGFQNIKECAGQSSSFTQKTMSL